jgi:hypothetical protein
MTEMTLTPYSTVTGLSGTVTGASNSMPTWVPWIIERERLFSYQLYEQIYWNVPDTFKLVARGTEDKPIYLPSGRQIVDVCDRYTGNNFGWLSTDPNCQAAFDALFAREAFLSQFQGNKLYGIMRGDWCWHIMGNATKPAGSRLTIRALDPGSYFPMFDEQDVDRVIGCHVVEMVDVDGEISVKRLTYRKTDEGITSEIGRFKLDEWGEPNALPQEIIQPVTLLDPRITALPVYHIKNFFEPQNPFGSSEMRGFERVIAAINQGISDEDLALALDGLGMYVTNTRAVDEDGNATDWDIGPAKVVEVNGTPSEAFFNRVQGIGSVTPSLDHVKFLIDQLFKGSATPDIAAGRVDVQVAESGIALLLQMSPILTKAQKKDVLLTDVHNQMFYDIQRGWLPVYEGISFDDSVQTKVTLGDKLPLNRKQRFDELVAMLQNGVIDTIYFRMEMSKLGYEFPEDLSERVATERTRLDPVSARLNAELEEQTRGVPSA